MVVLKNMDNVTNQTTRRMTISLPAGVGCEHIPLQSSKVTCERISFLDNSYDKVYEVSVRSRAHL